MKLWVVVCMFCVIKIVYAYSTLPLLHQLLLIYNLLLPLLGNWAQYLCIGHNKQQNSHALHANNYSTILLKFCTCDAHILKSWQWCQDSTSIKCCILTIFFCNNFNLLSLRNELLKLSLKTFRKALEHWSSTWEKNISVEIRLYIWSTLLNGVVDHHVHTIHFFS